MSASPLPQDDELARLQAELHNVQRQLGLAQAGLQDFAYTVSHDLRANLRHINAYAGLVREELGEALPAQAASYLDTVTQAARLMGRQIDALMAWSQLDRAQQVFAPLDLRALIDEVQQSLAAETAGRQIDWRVAADFPRLAADGALLRQLFSHLLSNAVKFTRPRAPAVIEIGVQPSADAGHCTLFVRDNGVGFNPRLQDKLFHVFQRLHSASEFDGLGMGLALVRKIAALHGGSVQAEGSPEAGCRISVTLPLVPPGVSAAAAP